MARRMASWTIKQWPSLGVRTKNDETATTYLLEIPDLLAVVEKWDASVRPCLPPNAVWYAPTVSQFGQFAVCLMQSYPRRWWS